MNGTPSLRSAFPTTPQSQRKWGNVGFGTAADPRGRDLLANAKDVMPPATSPESLNAPLIPLTVLDAPTQRLYVVAFYALLIAWRFYDYSFLVARETDSLWLFMKWSAIDGVVLYGLPSLRIPWLEWSSTSSTVLFLIHALFDAFLMFRIPVPLGIWFSGFARIMYDRELAVLERRVKPALILHNASLILGKQIVHILPEGSAVLNPSSLSLCLNDAAPTVELPILLNQSNPILIDLLRIDLETNMNETISIGMKETQRLKRQADKAISKNEVTAPRLLRYPVKKPGLYRLQKVLDESNLEVQRKRSDALVVRCPSAFVKALSQDRCKGSLSDFAFQVHATPPLKIKYSKIVNRKDKGFVVLPVHPANLTSPLSQQPDAGSLVKFDSKGSLDVTWARTQHIEVPLNETFGTAGGWRYSIEEIHDALGNVANYSIDDGQRSHKLHHGFSTEQVFSVHDRPRISFLDCSPQRPLKAPAGQTKPLPIKIEPISWQSTKPAQFQIQYLFTPQEALTVDGNHAVDAATTTITMTQNGVLPSIKQPGLYSLQSVKTQFCSGEILEPSNCLLLNPPTPELSLKYQNISDKCVGSYVGLLVDLDLVGSPPFRLIYNIHRRGGTLRPEVVRIDKLRAQLELRPVEAGHYTYEFLYISDAVYSVPHSLRSKVPILQQDVKPQASAHFTDLWPSRKACIEESASFQVRFSGEAPWTLKYELLKGSRKTSHTIDKIGEEIYTLWTDKLVEGGEYSLTLASVTDNSGCEVFLDEEAKISVRHQRPKAAFSEIDGQRSTLILEGRKAKIPLRLTGEPPWTVEYRRAGQVEVPRLISLSSGNDFLELTEQDVYELVDVKDAVCPGTVDRSASQFEVLWIARPTVRLANSFSVEEQESKHVKRPVCEGDQDSLEVSLTGNPPYHSKYTIKLKPDKGLASISTRTFQAGLGSASIQMDTSTSGDYEYKFVELGDHLYDHDRWRFTPLSVYQKVFSKPSARFTDPSKAYSYCLETDMNEQTIPISLFGTPPFSIEIGIRQHAIRQPDIINIPHVDSHTYNFRIPRGKLGLGRHSIFINKVRDANNCQFEMAHDPQLITVNVADIPSISPMETTVDYCVGDRISYVLSGTAPFNVFYTFQGADRKASALTTTFRRIAEKPGKYTITGVSDKASTDSCKAKVAFSKIIHELPSVRVSKGRVKEVDIHEGGDSEILFEFGGTPPFEFTYVTIS